MYKKGIKQESQKHCLPTKTFGNKVAFLQILSHIVS